MIQLHPKILERNGKKAFAILPYEKFVQIQQALQDFENIKDLREVHEKEKDV